jgi:nucleoside-diphosphate-sugar epimerase
MSRILVTGGFGLVGRWVVRELLARRHEVVVLELDTPRNRKSAREFPSLDVVWGDLRDTRAVGSAVAGCDTVVHMAFVITPHTERDPVGSEAINVGGTRNIIAACEAQAKPPRLLFTSSVEVYGKNRHLPGPRRIDDPLHAVNDYAAHKIECERLVRQSRLDHAIFRFAGVIDITLQSSHELMVEFPLDVRFEAVHAADVGLAVANAVEGDAIWGRSAILHIAGGPSCRTTYGQFLDGILTTLGVGPLPREAFTQADYPSDWLDTEESQRLLSYQRHSLEDIFAAIAGLLGWRRALVPIVRPLVRRTILRRSPYLRARSASM